MISSVAPLLLAGALGWTPADGASPPRPRLVVVMVVDQRRADYLDRFRGFLGHGLDRLRRDGRRYAAARHLHAVTSTGPGHATLSTGSHPARHGVVANMIPDDDAPGTFKRVSEDASVRNLGRDASGQSSRDLLVDALGDWMHAADPRSKVVTLAYKARAATMLGGRAPDACVWVDTTTCAFTSSTHYAATLPDWVAAYEREHPVRSYLGRVWEASLTESEFEEAGATGDAMRYEGRGGFDEGVEATFPHVIDEEADVVFTPFSDERVAGLAARALDALDLGRDDAPDLLGVSFSSADYVGHAYGMESRELVDYYARLDRAIADLMSAAERAAGPGRVLFVLSADHGIGPIVESLLSRGIDAGRVRTKVVLDTIDAALDLRFGEADWTLMTLPDVYLSREAIAARGVDPANVRAAAARAAVSVRGITAAYPRERLLAGDESIPASFRFSFHPRRSGDVMLRFAPHHHLDYLDVAPYVKANHATQYDYDQRIPVVFLGAGVEGGTLADPFPSIDVAPTIAAAIGVPVPAGVAGRARALGRER
ncbi:MAG: alkaline phosphatase family protein [Planctomycetota bacterium JB042]